MEIPQTRARSAAKSTEPACADQAGEHAGSAESDRARAIAQAESALREISLTAFSVRRRSPELSSSVRQKAESETPSFATIRMTKPYTHSYRTAAHFGIFDLRLAKAILDPLRLDPGLDFIVLDDGAIELTETGFRRMAQAHSAGLDVMIGVDGRDMLRLPARKADVVDASPGGTKNQRDGGYALVFLRNTGSMR